MSWGNTSFISLHSLVGTWDNTSFVPDLYQFYYQVYTYIPIPYQPEISLGPNTRIRLIGTFKSWYLPDKHWFKLMTYVSQCVKFRVLNIAKIPYSLLWCCQDTDRKNQGLICTTMTINCNFTDHGDLQQAPFSQTREQEDKRTSPEDARSCNSRVQGLSNSPLEEGTWE
jgi:hypothetical protein